MIYVHIHLMPWHWFWRDHQNLDAGITITWRGPFAIVWLNPDIWPDSKVKAIIAGAKVHA